MTLKFRSTDFLKVLCQFKFSGERLPRKSDSIFIYFICQTVSDHHILQDVISYATAWRSCTVCISMADISLVAVVATSRGDTCSN